MGFDSTYGLTQPTSQVTPTNTTVTSIRPMPTHPQADTTPHLEYRLLIPHQHNHTGRHKPTTACGDLWSHLKRSLL